MSKKTLLRVISALMLLVLAASMIVSCDKKENKQEGSTETMVGIEDKDDPNNPNIESKDYGGYEFGVIVEPYNEGLAYSTNYIYSEGETSEPLNDAVYRRNVILEDKYNISIQKIDVTDIRSEVRKQVMSGTVDFDLIITRCLYLATLARENLLSDLLSNEWFDMSKDYWDHNGQRDLMIGNKLFFTNCDLNAQELALFVYFNKQIVEDQQLTSPYEYMANNDWTLDNFIKLIKSVSDDLDGNGTMDEFDQYGILSEDHNARTLLYGAGIRVTTNDESGYPTVTLMSDKTVSVYEKIKTIFQDKDTSWNVYGMPGGDTHGFTDKWDYMRSWFCQDHFLFHIEGANIIAQFSDMESAFGIVPIPKGDASQADYASCYPMHCNLVAIPNAGDDMDRTGRIVEDMNYYSSLILMPAFYETVLSRKYMRDDESEANLSIIKSTRVYDIGLYYDFGGIRSKITDVECSNSNISTNYAKLKKAVETDIRLTYEKFTTIAG